MTLNGISLHDIATWQYIQWSARRLLLMGNYAIGSFSILTDSMCHCLLRLRSSSLAPTWWQLFSSCWTCSLPSWWMCTGRSVSAGSEIVSEDTDERMDTESVHRPGDSFTMLGIRWQLVLGLVSLFGMNVWFLGYKNHSFWVAMLKQMNSHRLSYDCVCQGHHATWHARVEGRTYKSLRGVHP